jgi:hypothetical protein
MGETCEIRQYVGGTLRRLRVDLIVVVLEKLQD